MRRIWYLFVLGAMALLATAGAQAQQDQGKKPVHVITDDDIKHDDTSSAQPAQPAATDADKDKDQANQPAADPADKRTDVQKAEDEVKKWKKEKSDLQRKLARVEDQAANETSEFRKQMYRDAVNNQQITLREFDQKIETAQKNLDEAKSKEQENGGAPEAPAEQPKQGDTQQQETPPQ